MIYKESLVTDEIIDQAIKSADRDQYGQVNTFDMTISRLLPKHDKQEVVEFLKTSTKYRLSLYGGSLGQFYAISRK